MSRKATVWLGVLVWCIALLSQSYQASQAAVPANPDEVSQRQSQSQRLMEQSDCQKRLNEERRARLEEKETVALASLEASSVGSDLAILVILAVSVVAVVLLSRRGRRTRTIH